MKNNFEFSPQDFSKIDISEFERWYDENAEELRFAEKKVHEELLGFGRQLEAHQLAKISVRLKSKDSFLGKIQKKQKNYKDVLEKHRDKDVIGVFDLVRDIVGARIVMYSTDAMKYPIRYLCTYGIFNMNAIEVYSLFNQESPFFPKIFKELETMFPHQVELSNPAVPIKTDVKKSGYESVHFDVTMNDWSIGVKEPRRSARIMTRYEDDETENTYPRKEAKDSAVIGGELPPDLIFDGAIATEDEWRRMLNWARQLDEANEGANVSKPILQFFLKSLARREKMLRCVKSIPLEIQVRTTMQDTWGQVEHSLRYKGDNAEEDGLSTLRSTSFNAQSMVMSSLERMQAVTQGLHRDIRGEKKVISSALGLGKRAMFYKSADERKIAKALDRQNTRLQKAVRENNSRVALESWDSLVSIIGELETEIGRKLNDFTCFSDVEEWSQARYIFLVIGFLLICGEESIEKKAVEWVSEQARGLNHQLPTMAFDMAAYIYDHISFMDAHFRHASETAEGRSFFSDPLVFYRNAFIAVRRQEFRRGISILKEPIQYDYFSPFWQYFSGNGAKATAEAKRSLRTLNPARFMRRIAEYHYASFSLNYPDGHSEINQCLRTLRAVLTDDGPEEGRSWAPLTEIVDVERAKSMCLLLEALYVQYVLMFGNETLFQIKFDEVIALHPDIADYVLNNQAATPEHLENDELRKFIEGSYLPCLVRAFHHMNNGDRDKTKAALRQAEERFQAKIELGKLLSERKLPFEEISESLKAFTETV